MADELPPEPTPGDPLTEIILASMRISERLDRLLGEDEDDGEEEEDPPEARATLEEVRRELRAVIARLQALQAEKRD